VSSAWLRECQAASRLKVWVSKSGRQNVARAGRQDLPEKSESIPAKSRPVEVGSVFAGDYVKRRTERIFREAAIERLSNPEQLDHVVGVTRPFDWMAAAALAGNPPLAHEWGVILTEHTAPPELTQKHAFSPEEGQHPDFCRPPCFLSRNSSMHDVQ